MYRNLSPKALGITGRQSEIIELALTYGFPGMELDIQDFIKRVEHRDLEHASRFVKSAQINIGGFDLPVRWRGDESVYKADLEQLSRNSEYAVEVGAKICHTVVLPGSDSLPYHENFELHRQRLAEITEKLAGYEIRLGLGYLVAPSHREDQQYQFIQDAEALVTLIKSVSAPNLGLLLDTWNWHFGGGTIDMVRSLGADSIEAVHIADAPADANAETLSDEQRTLLMEGGSVDNIAYLTMLQEIEYQNGVTLAPHPKCFSGMTRDAIVQKCSNVLEDLWRTLGLGRKPAGAAADAS